MAERKRLGLHGLVSGLQSVIINTEPQMQKAASEELLRYRCLEFQSAFQDTDYKHHIVIACRIVSDRPLHVGIDDVSSFSITCKEETITGIGRAFKGIDEILELTVSGGQQTATKIGDRILVEEDWRIEAGEIDITVQN